MSHTAQLHQDIDDISNYLFGDGYLESPDEALTLPIILLGASRPAAVFINGVSARLRMKS